MTKLEITDEESVDFIAYRKNKTQIEAILPAWRQVIDFTTQLGSGSYTLTVQNGLPVRINNPMQTVLIGIKL